MKGHDSTTTTTTTTKVARMEDILNVPVQNPSCGDFSATQLKWVKVGGGRQGGDDISLIPFSRVDDFVKGESSNAECPASFRIESRRKRTQGSLRRPRVDAFLEYRLYWCSYGPDDYRGSMSSVGGNSNIKPSTGKGSRPGRRHMMRGCLCHFTVKRLYVRPLLALIIYNQRQHVDKSGAPCHGLLDQAALGTRAMYAPRISEELRHRVISMLYVGISIDDIIHHHTEVVQRHGGPHKRDDFLTRNDVRNMERVVHNSSHEMHVNDESSVKLWVQRHAKQVFFFQEISELEPFVLGIQTEWQLQQILQLGKYGSLASHSALGSKKLKYHLCTLLAFDSSQTAIPVAWIITSSVGQDINNWLVPLIERIRTKDSTWRLNTFLVNDPSFEVSTMREAFQCRVALCTWHIRRSLMKSLLKRCRNVEVQREICKQFGFILYSARSGINTMDAVEEFMQVFVDQCSFIDHFKSKWLPFKEFWVDGIGSLPVASIEPMAAIESYHLTLKSKLLSNRYSNCWQRVDWLIHTLTTEFHSLYWLNHYIVETGTSTNLRDESFSSNAWYPAVHIPDIDVILDERNCQLAKVISQTDRTIVHTIWNPGSEFSLCSCHESNIGNLCKHIIKVVMLCRTRQVLRQPLLASQVYQHTLLTLLHNAPDDPLVLEHAILHATRLQQDIKGLEEMSKNGVLQPLNAEMNSPFGDNLVLFPHSIE